MRLTIRQVTYLLDSGIIKAQDFDSVAVRNEPYPSHLMLLQKGGMISWDQIEEYEHSQDYSVVSLLNETSLDQQMMNKYNYKFISYIREQLASSKLNSFPTISIVWDKIEKDIPDLAKFFFIKRLAKFGINLKRIGHYEDGPEYYLFDVTNRDSDPNIYYFQ